MGRFYKKSLGQESLKKLIFFQKTSANFPKHQEIFGKRKPWPNKVGLVWGENVKKARLRVPYY